MSDNIDDALSKWKAKIDIKTAEMITASDKGFLKAAFFCEGEVKKNLQAAINSTVIPFDDIGGDMWKRTGLALASIGSGMDSNNLHSAIIFASAPYAKYLEYGTGIYAVNGNGRQTPWVFTSNTGAKVFTHGMKPRPFMWPAISQNKDKIREIIKQYIGEAVK